MQRKRVHLDESVKQAKRRSVRELIDAKTRHANWSAKKYATVLLDGYEGTGIVARVGGVLCIRSAMTAYLIHPALHEHAATQVVAILTSKGRA